MSTDARLSTGLPSHPKTKKLIRRVGEAGAWHLICLILWTRSDRPDGDLAGMSNEDIELAVDWRGEPDAFVHALVAVGFLDGAEHEYRLHDWAEHQPWANGSEARSEKARWASLCRRHGREEAARQMPEYASKLASSTDSAASSTKNSASSSDVALLDSASGTKTPAPSPNPSPNPNPSPRAEQPSSSAQPTTDLLGGKQGPDDLKAVRAQRLAQVADEAIAAFNASPLTKANGGLVPNISATVGREKRQQQVAKCLRVARQICAQDYGSQTITPEFWTDYWTNCHADEHKSGRGGGGRDHSNWKPSFEYLTREATMLEVYDKASSEDAA